MPGDPSAASGAAPQATARLSIVEARAELREATDRLLASLAGWDDAMTRAPSALPGWTRGHVLTHLARNADGMGNLVQWATTGRETPMYPSAEARAAGIEAGAGRPAGELVADVAESAARLDAALEGLTGPPEEALVQMGPSRTSVQAWWVPLHRLREVEIHHVDLGADFGPADWPEPFVLRTLDQVAPVVLANGGYAVGLLVADEGGTWRLADQGATLRGPRAELLAWVIGRSDGVGLTLEGDARSGMPAPPARWS